MFLNVLSEAEQRAFLRLAHLVAVADGYMDEKEARVMAIYKQETGLDFVAEDTAETVEELVAQFVSDAGKNAVFVELLSLILSDGEYSDEERDIVRRIKRGFGFSPEKYETCKAWVRKINETYQEGLAIVHG